MNWGNKMLLVFLVFALLMGTLVYKCTQTRFDLVSSTYYKDELRYQEVIDASANAKATTGISLRQAKDTLFIDLPDKEKDQVSEGEAWLYCSFDAARDKKFPLQPLQNRNQFILKKQLYPGNYQLRLKWKSGPQSYYVEQPVNIW